MSELYKTAPPRIWLQISDEPDDDELPFPEIHEGITWCQDSVMSCEVEYVRADLVRAALGDEPADPSPGHKPE